MTTTKGLIVGGPADGRTFTYTGALDIRYEADDRAAYSYQVVNKGRIAVPTGAAPWHTELTVDEWLDPETFRMDLALWGQDVLDDPRFAEIGLHLVDMGCDVRTLVVVAVSLFPRKAYRAQWQGWRVD